MIKKVLKNRIFFVLLFIALFYLLFPTQNSTLDAYSFAADIKYGNHLFSYHHLFYNVFLYLLNNVLTFFGISIDVLVFAKIVNSIFVILSLWVIFKILKNLKIPEKQIFISILFIAFSFNVWRFGTENEAYIIPIFFSLLGSLYFLKYLENEKLRLLFFSGFFAAIACLFHQIHVFWWFGLLIGSFIGRKKGTFITYAISSIIVPISYGLVIKFYSDKTLNLANFIQFIFHDYYTGTANTNVNRYNIIMTGISSIRTFFQVHPQIILLIKSSFFYVIPLIFLPLFLFYGIKNFRTIYQKRRDINIVFFKVHMLIFILQFLFAAFSGGNVEFMVMLPFLLILSVLYKYLVNEKVMIQLVMLLFVWNFLFGIFPNYHYKYYNDEHLTEYIIKHPKQYFVVKND